MFFFIVVLFSCSNETAKQNESAVVDKEKLLQWNKELIAEEHERIAEYVNRYQYNMRQTETGLNYLIIKEGNGKQPVFESEVQLDYRLDLLDGTPCYSSDSTGSLHFKLGQSNEPSGLQEGVLKLREGAKAIIIVPSYLAYGLTGDGQCIGGKQTLVYTVELLKVN